jgi:phage shock protein PspC (stress-responsive transcriptional regulator)
MKKNITINLCGRLFQIDEDAYEMLQHYTESLRASFGKEEGGEEIADDIEERIAELFDELKQNGVEAITIDHVKDIITRIGEPEQLTNDDSGEWKEESGKNSGHRYDSFRSAAEGVYDNVRARTSGKRLYRNPNDRMIAGVMSGLAAYTNTDVTWWRLGIVLSVLIYGFGILAYIVLAIVLPSAKTPEEQLQMQGREVTPQNLANVVVENGQMPVKRNGCLGAFVTALLVLFAVIVGLPLLVSLFLVVISFIVVFTVPTAVHLSLPFDIGFLELPELITLYPWAVVTFMVGLLLTLLIPVYAIAHMFFSRANKIKPMGIGQRIFWVVLWVASLCCMIPSLIWIQEKNSERHHNEYSDTVIYQRMEMDRESKDFLRQGDWTIVKAENCAHYTYCGYYNDNPQVRFLDTFNEDCKEVFHVEHKERVEPGVYRLECMARAEGPGTCIFAVGEGKHLSSIPVRSQIDGEYSMGWTPIVIDNIVVSDNGITYGMSPDSTFTGLNCRAKWFSAIDFKLEKIK